MGSIKESQEYYEKMLSEALIGMNIGVSEEFTESGERNVLEYIKDKVILNDQKIVLFDVGANVGNYTRQLLEIFGDKAEIHSFEPSPKTFSLLKGSGITGAVLHNLGFSDKTSEETLYSNTSLLGLSSLYKRRLDHFGIVMGNSEVIKLDTIDNFCKSNNIDKISFLKLDAEGNEFKILSGTISMLKNIQYIQFEFGGCNIDSKTYFQDFWYTLKNNFKIYRILKEGLFELTAYKEVYEIFRTTNFLAEKIL